MASWMNGKCGEVSRFQPEHGTTFPSMQNIVGIVAILQVYKLALPRHLRLR